MTDVTDPAAEYEPFPPERRTRRRRRVLAAIGMLLVLVLLVAGAGFFWYQGQVDPSGSPGEPVNVTIPLGSSTQRIASILDEKEVIGSARVFRLYTRLNGGGPFQAGEYTFRQNSAFSDIIAVLEKGPEITFERLTIPEGLTLPQIAERVGKMPGRSGDRFLQLAKSGTITSPLLPQGATNLEGLLLPETYNLEPKDDEEAILRRMVDSFATTARDLGIDQAQSKVGISSYQAIVVASLIERETRFDEERPRVASVIYNRLKRGQLLQVDATVIYALGRTGERNIRVLFKDLEVDSPYNTYRVKGLPPTPIAAPGRASIEAALNPDSTPFLFYVVTETDGRHSFATTSAEHTANIRKAERNGVR